MCVYVCSVFTYLPIGIFDTTGTHYMARYCLQFATRILRTKKAGEAFICITFVDLSFSLFLLFLSDNKIYTLNNLHENNSINGGGVHVQTVSCVHVAVATARTAHTHTHTRSNLRIKWAISILCKLQAMNLLDVYGAIRIHSHNRDHAHRHEKSFVMFRISEF